MIHKYEEQWGRVKRWYKRFQDINEGKPHTQDTDYYVDDVYSFFINCYHLKDWIIHDDTLKINDRENLVYDFINSIDCLLYCADICNSIKHLKLTHPPKTGTQPEFKGKDFDLKIAETIGKIEQKTPIISIKFHIETSIGNQDAFIIATECMKSWERFINDKLL